MTAGTLGPWVYTMLAALALEALDVQDLAVEGEEMAFKDLDGRFPDKAAADRMGEATEEAVGLNIVKNAMTETFTRRAKLFTGLQKERVNLPSVAKGY